MPKTPLQAPVQAPPHATETTPFQLNNPPVIAAERLEELGKKFIEARSACEQNGNTKLLENLKQELISARQDAFIKIGKIADKQVPSDPNSATSTRSYIPSAADSSALFYLGNMQLQVEELLIEAQNAQSGQ
ncbi:Uncharacterised protein [Candidatus Gugararchaeum adminiculabundum]|nr:Uncharacterised protein [Candidatus Gugararchaeum adminiculabundum]